MLDLLKYKKISLPSWSWGFSFVKSWLVSLLRHNLYSKGIMFIICSLIRIRASWKKLYFLYAQTPFAPRDSLAVPAKPELSLHGSLWVWFCVDICLVSQFPEAVVAATSLYPCSWIGPCPRHHGVRQAYVNLLVLRNLRHLASLLFPYVPLGSRNTTFLGFPYSSGYSSPSSSLQP